MYNQIILLNSVIPRSTINIALKDCDEKYESK
jgi:hypothetical protein